MKRISSPIFFVGVLALSGCSHFGNDSTEHPNELAARQSTSAPSGPMEKRAERGPLHDASRAFDCMGKNQTPSGVTRPDCLPNDADGAARDTMEGAGR